MTSSKSESGVNEKHVLVLVDAALTGMKNAMVDETYSSAELFSAVLTLTAKVVHVMLNRGADEAYVHSLVEMIFSPFQSSPKPRIFDKRMN